MPAARSLHADRRGQSFTYLIAGGTAILGAGLITVFDSPITQLLTSSRDQCVTQTCQTGVDSVQAAWNWFPLVILGFFLVMIIAASVWQSRSP